MNEEIILESLKHNIPLEYVRSCDTSDGIGYYEEDTESWQCQLYNYINYLQKQNTELKEENERLQQKTNYLLEKNIPFVKELIEEKQQLEDNWNKLKEYCKNNYYGTTTIGILEQMKEIEGDSDE